MRPGPRIVSADGSTLLDLSATGLVTHLGSDSAKKYSSLQPRFWSPDGRMLVLVSGDGTYLAILSVDPAVPGAVGTALPTPVASAGVLTIDPVADLPGAVSRLVSDPGWGSLWYLGGSVGGPIDLYRYEIATGTTTKKSLEGSAYDPAMLRLAIAPTGAIWIGSGWSIVVYDPATGAEKSLVPPDPGSDAQVDPASGKPNPWVSGIAFDASGNAVIARNWVRSLVVVDPSLNVVGTPVDVTDGFPMTGDLAVAGSRAFLVVDPSSGLMISVDLTRKGPNTKGGGDSKASASSLVAVGDRVLTAGSPPAWFDSSGGGVAMIEPALAAADLVATGPNGTSALYSNESGAAQWRDKDGRVAAQATTAAGGAQPITAIALDAQNRLWGVEQAGGGWRLVELRPA
jgi:hypothetical protein